MTRKILHIATLACAMALAANAGAGTDHSISRDLAVSPPPAATSGWEFAVGIPGWLTGLDADIGIGGFDPVHVDLPFSKLLPHIDMVAALGVEAQHGPLGFFFDGLYMKLGADGDTPGRLLDSINLQIRMGLMEAGAAYRLWEGKRGYFDLIAGARYIYIGSTMNFNVDSAGVQSVSEDLAAEAVGRVTSAVKSAVSDLSPELKARASSKISAAAQSRIATQVDQILQKYPRLPEAINAIKGANGPVSDAVRELIAAKVAEQQATLSDATAAVNARVAAAKAQARAKTSRAVQQAERKLARQIETAVKGAIPEEASGSQSWVEPFVGFRGRFNFTDHLYAMARADIGGFNVGSKLAWQTYGAVGWQFNRHWSTELGYRYLSEDYANGGFVFKGVVSGAYLGITYKL